jgi:predicted GNAT family N-acyltransferase
LISTKWFTGNEDIIDAHTIRAKVFINEQNVPQEVEMDDKDREAVHVVVYNDEKAIATGRLLNQENEFLIGRIAVLKEERQKGFGDLVVKMLLRKAEDKGAKEVMVHAQMTASKFYQKLGFVAVGSEYIEEDTNIPHIHMVKYIRD